MNNTILRLRARFVNDFNLPIQVLHSPYFEYYLDLYEDTLNTKSLYDNLMQDINTNYNGNIEKWIEHYSLLRDKIITTVENSESFKYFNQKDMIDYSVSYSIPNKDLYTETNNNQFFLSVDLVKANFQALRFFDKNIVFNQNTYEDFISIFDEDKYFQTSKYTRQVIFGKLNPKKTIIIEKYIMYLVYEIIKKIEQYNNIELYSVQTDELIFKSSSSMTAQDCMVMQNIIQNILNINVRVKNFRIEFIDIRTSKGDKIPVFKKHFIDSEKYEIKQAPMTYYPQIFKLLNNMSINDEDLIFYYEHQLAKFLEPLYIQK